MHIFFTLLLSLFIAQDESVMTTASGGNLAGTLESISRDSIQFKTANGIESIGFEQISNVVLDDAQPQAPELAPIGVVLVDDSTIRAISFLSGSGKSQIETADKFTFEVENRNVHSVLLKPHSEEEAKSQWALIQRTPLDSGDAIVVRRSGRLETIEGIVGNISPEKVEFKLGDRTGNIDRSKIIGLMFYHAKGRKMPEVKCQLTLNDGSILQLRQLELAGDSFLAMTCSGVRFELLRSSVARLDFSLGRAVFLGSMMPSNRDWTPLIAGSAILEKLKRVRLPRANRSFDDRPLELLFYPDENDVLKMPRSQTFDNGYAMVGGSKLVFSLDRQYERLTGLAGFSPTADSGGNVTLKIRCDNRIVLQQQLRKSENKNPLKLDIDVKDVQRLVIEVDYHDGRSIGDMIHLCNLKVSR